MSNIETLVKSETTLKEVNSIINSFTTLPQVTRNEKSFALDLRKGEKKEAKGMQYYGVNITVDNFAVSCGNIGIDICAPLMETTINTKLQNFNIAALDNCIGEGQANIVKWGALTEQEKFDKFNIELTRLVSNWSARELSSASAVKTMITLGEELGKAIASGDTIKISEIQKEMGEVAMAMATKASVK